MNTKRTRSRLDARTTSEANSQNTIGNATLYRVPNKEAAPKEICQGLFGPVAPLPTKPALSVAPVSPWVDRLTLCLWMCDQHQLPRYREEVMSLLVEAIRCLDDVAKVVHYACLPLQTRVDLLEALCRKLDGSHTQS